MNSPMKLKERMIKKLLRGAPLILAVFLLFTGGCRSLGVEKSAERETVRFRSYYECPITAKPVVIDGSLDDPAWEDAQKITDYGVIKTFQEPVHPTTAWIMWDEQFLYVGFDAVDPEVKAIHTERNSDTYRDDVLEIFFKTDPDEFPYYNFEINPLGTINDGYHTREKRFSGDWDCEDIKVGVTIVGEINNPEVEDERWFLEVAIPFASLPSLEGRTTEPGDEWLFHLPRIDRSKNLPEEKELTSNAPVETWFHDSEYWVRLIFKGPEDVKD